MINDAAARKRALDTATSFAVSAPAGSGKTGLLTQRVLALLAQCNEPENILAITFTRKAAAEMQSRIIKAISQAAITPEPKDDYQKKTWQLAQTVLKRDQEKQWQLLQCPNRLRITTIDSLCRSISERTPFDSLLGGAPEILDDPNIAYQAASRETLALLHSKNELQEDLVQLVKHFDNNLDKIEQLFTQLLAKRDQWLGIILQSGDKRDVLESMLKEVIEDELSITRTLLAPVASELCILADHAAKNFNSHNLNPKNNESLIKQCLGITQLPTPDTKTLLRWQGLSALLLTKEGKLRAKPTKDIGFFALSNKTLSKEEQATAKTYKLRMENLLADCGDIPSLEKQLAIIKHLPHAQYDNKQWQLLNSLTRILRHLALELQISFQQLGKADYLSITLAAIDALGYYTEEYETPSDLALALDYNIQHILIDEFQDNSTTQLQLLHALTRGWQRDDGRTLFIVGDPMQSCYRFRDDNVGIFLDARKDGIGDIALEALNLEVNFRSQAGIVDWVNSHFAHIFPLENSSSHAAVKYHPSIAIKENSATMATKIHLLANEDNDLSTDQGEYITQLIHEHRQSKADDSIAILVRNKTHAKAIIPALIATGIDYRATDIDKLNTCMPIVDLLSLTRALLHPDDRMAWIAVLRAPWCGLDMNDLLLATSSDSTDEKNIHHTVFQQLQDCLNNHLLSPQGHQRLQRFYIVIKQAILQQQRFLLHHWVKRIWLDLGGPALLIDSNDHDNIERFFDLLAEQQHAGLIKQWSQLENAVENLFARQAPHSDNPIEIMTIHKSKGLEFDVVLIPGLEKKSRSADKELITWMEKPNQHGKSLLLLSPLHAKGSEEDLLYEYIHTQHKEKDTLETDRLLYVACTRAIKKLHLIANVIQEDDAIKTPPSGTLLYRLWNALEDNDKKNIQLLASTKAQKQQHPNKIIALDTQWQKPPLTENRLLKPWRGNNHLAEVSGDNIASPDDLLQREQRYLGTVIHLALQQIADTGYRQWDQHRIKQQLPFWRSKLIEQGIVHSQLEQVLDTLLTAINNTLADNKGCWILDNNHQESATELVIFNHHGQHVIDRTFIEIQDDNTKIRWIIDYKTGSPDTAALEKYRAQLQRYAQLFLCEQQEKNITVKTALYFPLKSQWKEFSIQA